MSDNSTSKIGNLAKAEKEIKDKQGPNQEKNECSEDSKDKKSDMQSEGGNS